MMKNSDLQILLLEDNHVETALFEEMLRSALPGARIHTCHTIKAAQQLLAEHVFRLLIIDIHLPDGNGIDFLCDVRMTQPDADAVLITANPLSEYRNQVARIGQYRILSKPVRFETFAEAIMGGEAAEVPDREFRGALNQLTPTDIVQLKCIARATTTMKFTSEEGEVGLVYIAKGELCHAEVGELAGLDALARMIGWKRGSVEELDRPPVETQTLRGDWQSVMLQAVQLADERL